MTRGRRSELELRFFLIGLTQLSAISYLKQVNLG